MAGREPALALEQPQAVRDSAGLLQGLEWTRGAARSSHHHTIIRVRPAAIIARVEDVIIIVVADDPGRFDQPRKCALDGIGPDDLDGGSSGREGYMVLRQLLDLDRL